MPAATAPVPPPLMQQKIPPVKTPSKSTQILLNKSIDSATAEISHLKTANAVPTPNNPSSATAENKKNKFISPSKDAPQTKKLRVETRFDSNSNNSAPNSPSFSAFAKHVSSTHSSSSPVNQTPFVAPHFPRTIAASRNLQTQFDASRTSNSTDNVKNNAKPPSNNNSNPQNLRMQIYTTPSQTPLNNDKPDTVHSVPSFTETVNTQNPIPKLWEINPSTTSQNFGGTCKPPKHILGKWDGEVATYPDFISSFNEFIHQRADILVPQKIQILEAAIPSEIALKFRLYDKANLGYQHRLQFLDSRYGDPSILRNDLWSQIVHHPPATADIISVRDTLDNLVALVDKYRKYAQSMIDEEQLFYTVIEKFPTDSYTSYLRDPTKNVKPLFDAIRSHISIRQLSNRHGIPTVVNSNPLPPLMQLPTPSFEEDTHSCGYQAYKKSPYRKHGKFSNSFSGEPKKCFTTHKKTVNRDKSQYQSSNKKTSTSFTEGSPGHLSFFGGRQAVESQRYPSKFYELPDHPVYPCIFCTGDHYAHLCTQVSQLAQRKKFLDERSLCHRCFGRHPKDGQCTNRQEKYCRWFNCVEGTHSAAVCPNQQYPISRGHADAWHLRRKELARDVPADIAEQLRQQKLHKKRGISHDSFSDTAVIKNINSNHSSPLQDTVATNKPTGQLAAENIDIEDAKGLRQAILPNTKNVDAAQFSAAQKDALPKMSKHFNFTTLLTNTHLSLIHI